MSNGKIKVIDVLITGSATSPLIQLGGGQTVVGVIIPASVVGASLAFHAAPTAGGTFVAVQDKAGNALSITMTASTHVTLDPSATASLEFVKLVSASSETAKTFKVIVSG